MKASISAPVDPIVVRRARDLLERADLLLDNADGVPDLPERFRQYYLAALRGAGSILAVFEPTPPTARRRGSRSAWSRLSRVLPGWAPVAERLASLSDVRLNIESGHTRTVDPAMVARLRRDAVALLDEADATITAYEQGKSTNSGRPEIHLVS